VGARCEVDVSALLADTFRPSTFVHAFRFLGEHPGLVWAKTVEHLELSAAAMALALVIAIPLGVVLGHLHRGSFLAINVANIGRALPSLAVIAIGLAVFGIGFTNVMVALIVLAVPLMLTNAFVAVNGVDPDAVDAAKGMGMRPWQVLVRVELPLALPLIFAGIRTAAVYVVSTATLAAIAGGGGLGDIIVNQASYRLEGVIAAALCVSALALLADFAFGALELAVTPRPLRRRRGRVVEPDVVTGLGAK
jgi:osmoprotectant transport system permease protein